MTVICLGCGNAPVILHTLGRPNRLRLCALCLRARHTAETREYRETLKPPKTRPEPSLPLPFTDPTARAVQFCKENFGPDCAYLSSLSEERIGHGRMIGLTRRRIIRPLT